jgi:hypothetical protein
MTISIPGGAFMKSKLFPLLAIGSLLLAGSLVSPPESFAEVNVNIGVGLPGLMISAPPAMVVIPGTYVYYPPDVGVDIFFYRGYWYRPYRGRWFISAEYNGPWGGIALGRVPRVLISLPPTYRHVPPGYERMPYGMVRKNWKGWERDRHWDRHEDRREDRGREHREERGER